MGALVWNIIRGMNDNHSGKRPADLGWNKAIDYGGLTRGALGLIVGLISAC